MAAALAAWEALAASGLLFRDVVPSLAAIGAALARVLGTADFYANLAVTAQEIGIAVVIGGLAGLATGILLGATASCRRPSSRCCSISGRRPRSSSFR